MKLLLLFLFISFIVTSSGQLPDKTIRDLKTGRIKEDTSYVYWLPYKKGKRHLFVQGANSKFSHQNELSYDFKMKTGSLITAARGGVVIATKSDSNKGGAKDEFLGDGNHIIIQHADGSEAMYWHLQQNGVSVKVGDTVTQGQAIGTSGNTGYSAFPHLHFQLVDKTGKGIIARFLTKKGTIYLRPGRWYRSINR